MTAPPVDAAPAAAPAASALLLLLADSRLPAGGHAHSGGIEAAVSAGLVHDEPTLLDFLDGRLHTAGLVAAALAAAACAAMADEAASTGEPRAAASRLRVLDAEADARTPSPALRAASRAQGRALLRAAAALVAAPRPLDRPDPHHAVVLGAAGGALGLAPHHAALVAASGAVSGPASAALRLLGLDPLGVTRVQAELAGAIDRVARAAAASAATGGEQLQAAAAPMLDLLAERHAACPVRLFAS